MTLSKIIPIRVDELAKFLSTSLIMILTIYVYSILRGVKDTLVVSELGAELISTIKLYGTFPMAVLFMLLYTKLADYFTRVQIYHVVNWMFVGFFILFDFVLYPNASYIHFDFSNLAESYPTLKYPLVMIGNWSISLFYIMSELWGTVMLSLMFWQLANQINTVDEAKRFYPLFGFLGQIGLVLAGFFMVLFTKFGADWKISLRCVTTSVLLSGILISAVVYVLGHRIVGNDVINGASKKAKKEKIGLVQSLKYIFSSKYIGLITLLVLCYGVSMNLVEGVWKKQLGIQYPEHQGYAHFMGQLQMCTGIATFIAMLVGSFALRKFTWKTVALATPIIIAVTGIPFFLFAIYQDGLSDYTFGYSVLFFAVLFGGAQNVLSKGIKYAFFDPTKEMTYIPLDNELKAKGKAAVDVVGGRLGKSGGAIIQWLMLTFITGSTLVSLAPHMFTIFMLVIVIWFFAISALSKEFTAKTKGGKQ